MKSLLIILSVFILACKGESPKEPSTITTSIETAVSTIFLVRHAEKADDGTRDPDLTDEGIARARRLADMLQDEDIGHIFSSDYKRTRQTAEPLAKELQLEVQSYNPGDFTELLKFIKENSGHNMLIVGHSNSTPNLCNAILGEEKYAQIDESDYGNLFKIKLGTDLKSSELIRF